MTGHAAVHTVHPGNAANIAGASVTQLQSRKLKMEQRNYAF